MVLSTISVVIPFPCSFILLNSAPWGSKLNSPIFLSFVSFMFLINGAQWGSVSCNFLNSSWLNFKGICCISYIMLSFCSTEQGFLHVWGAIFQMLSLPDHGGFCAYGDSYSKILCTNLFLSSSRSKGSYKCMDLRCEILFAKMISVLLCSKVTWLILAISVTLLFTFELMCAQWEIYAMEHGHILWLPLHHRGSMKVS